MFSKNTIAKILFVFTIMLTIFPKFIRAEDDNNNVLDSLFVAGSQEILEAGTVNFSVPTSDVNYGRVTSPGKKTVDVILTKEQYKGLLANNQAKILYSAKFNTIENAALKNVKFFPQDYIDIKVSAKVDLTLSLN